MQIDSIALRYLSTEELCTAFELDEFIRLNGGTAADATRLRAEWTSRGWIESIEQGSALPPLLRLTGRAFADLPWLALNSRDDG
jgi:hypothetical protein